MRHTLRPCQLPDDYAAIAALLSQVSRNPVKPKCLAEDDERLPDGSLLHRLLAIDESGAAVGYGYARRYPFERAGQFMLRAHTAPAHQRQGIGSALLAALEAYALDNGATAIHTTVRDDDPASLAYAQRRGFVQERHLFSSSLDVTRFDDAAFAEQLRAAEAGGIRFATLADEPGDATERALYELDKHACADNPGEDLPDFLPFDDWRKLTVGRQGVRPELVHFARDGERIVAMTDMTLDLQTGTAHVGFTGVYRAYRGRGLALALKVVATQAARRCGAVTIKTENDSRNAPMLAVNRRLGYVDSPGIVELKRTVAGA